MRNANWLRALCALFLTISSIVMAGCNTMAGAGEDIGAAGKGLKHSAEEHKPY
jgi:predicted small secreted protein